MKLNDNVLREQLAGGVPCSLRSEQQTFKDLSIDVAVIAAVPYLHGRTTFHLISMTFHRQPSMAAPRTGEGESEKERGVLDNMQLTSHMIPNTIDLCWLPTGTAAQVCILT